MHTIEQEAVHLQVSRLYFSNLPVDPVHFIADHADSMKNVATTQWAELDAKYQFFLQCYPHIKINLEKKKHMFTGRKKEEQYQQFVSMVIALHSWSGSLDMFMYMALAAYVVWTAVWKQFAAGKWFWNSYCAGDWNNWALCMVEVAGQLPDMIVTCAAGDILSL